MSVLTSLAIVLFTFVVALPPAAKVLAITIAVYGFVQGMKKIPALTPYITGWVAIVVNLVLQVGGLFITLPPDQLYTANTLYALIGMFLQSAGAHGTVRSFSPPTILAKTPPNGEIKEVPAVVEPVDPADEPVDDKK